MPKVHEKMPIMFVRYSGTENGLANQDTTACTDSLASMMANTVFVLDPLPSVFEDVVAPVNDPSTYNHDA
ncbi:MAG: hypothetical protein ACRESZ_04740 [Methylococcales bacterium]